LKILYHSAHINYHIDNITRLNLTLREYVTLRNRDLYELSPSLKLKKTVAYEIIKCIIVLN